MTMAAQLLVSPVSHFELQLDNLCILVADSKILKLHEPAQSGSTQCIQEGQQPLLDLIRCPDL